MLLSTFFSLFEKFLYTESSLQVPFSPPHFLSLNVSQEFPLPNFPPNRKFFQLNYHNENFPIKKKFHDRPSFQFSGKNRQILLNVIVLQTSTNSGFEAVPKTVISLCIGI